MSLASERALRVDEGGRSPGAALALGVLLAVPLAVSLVLYWPVIAIDGGWLFVADSQRYLRHPSGTFHPSELMRFTGLHFVPLPRLIYATMQALFDTWWTPWGIAAVTLHALLVAAVGVVIHRYSRSLLAALLVMVPLVTSWALSSGVLTNFAHACLALLMTMLVLTPVLADQFVLHPSGRSAATLFVASLVAIFMSIPGALFYAGALVFYVGLKYARGIGTPWRAGLWRLDRQDAVIVSVMAVSALIYSVTYWIALNMNGWRFPTQINLCTDTSGFTLTDRTLQVLAFAYAGLFATPYEYAALGAPTSLWRTAAGVATVALLGASAYALVSRRPVLVRHRPVTVVVAGCLVMALLGTAMLVMGRSCIGLWHMRYIGYPLLFLAAMSGTLLGVALRALPVQIRPYLAALLLVGMAWLTTQNVQAVLASTFMTGRTPGAYASQTLDRDLELEP